MLPYKPNLMMNKYHKFVTLRPHLISKICTTSANQGYFIACVLATNTLLDMNVEEKFVSIVLCVKGNG